MNSPKLLEAISELESQRSVIDDAITHLKRAYAALNGVGPKVERSVSDQSPSASDSNGASARRSFVSEAVEILEKQGHSLHLRDIVKYITSVRGQAQAQASVGVSLIREGERAKIAGRVPRVVKVGPNTFDIPRDS